MDTSGVVLFASFMALRYELSATWARLVVRRPQSLPVARRVSRGTAGATAKLYGGCYATSLSAPRAAHRRVAGLRLRILVKRQGLERPEGSGWETHPLHQHDEDRLQPPRVRPVPGR